MRGKKVLVVDDSATVRQQVSAALSAAGFEVLEAFDGADGIEKIEGNPEIGLVILDVNMPPALFESIVRGTPRRELLIAIANWKLEPVTRHLVRLGEQAKGVAKRLDKELTVQIDGNDLRICGESWAPVWSTLAPVIRNAVDHGIEAGGEVEIQSDLGAGTTVRCRFPDSAMGGAWVASVRSVTVADSLAPHVA